MVVIEHGDNPYLYKIESQNFFTGVRTVRIVQECKAKHIICVQIQHGMQSNMG